MESRVARTTTRVCGPVPPEHAECDMQGDRAANQRGRAVEDLGRRTILEPLFHALRPSTVLICWIDQEPDPAATLPGAPGATATSCISGELEAALGAGRGKEVIWLRGHPGWHTVRALAG